MFNQNLEQPTLQTNGYDGSEPTRKCLHCFETKPLSAFGYRRMDKITNKIRNQSWCKECRAKNKHNEGK